LSASPSPRSSIPLAAAGIASLGLLPVLGGPDQPLHWAMTAGMVGFGVLLFVRYQLGRPEGALLPITPAHAQIAGRAVLIVSGAIAFLVAVIVAAQAYAHGPIGVLSLAMPGAGLAWLTSLGLKALRHVTPTTEEATPHDRPSRRPPRPSKLPPATTNGASSNRQLSA
jgi:hypothetical protein